MLIYLGGMHQKLLTTMTKELDLSMHATIHLEQKHVVIIGWPASGKTYLSKLLHQDNPGHRLFHTDDYIHHGYDQALYALMKDVLAYSGSTIVEGMQGYRLLRKGAEFNCFYPDIVIELEITEQRMLQTYAEQRKNKDVGALKGFIRSQATILSSYHERMKSKPDKKPQWIKLKNNY
jgi:hypothetical protein